MDQNKLIPTYKEDSIQIHYKRKDRMYSSWALWLWKYPDGEGKEFDFNGVDDFGAVASYPLSLFPGFEKGGIGLIIKSNGSWFKKDNAGDRIILLSKFVKDDNGVYHVYLQNDDAHVYRNSELTVLDEIEVCKFVDFNKILLSTNHEIDEIRVYENGKICSNKKIEPTKSVQYSLEDGKRASFENAYKLEVRFVKTGIYVDSPIRLSALYKSKEFVDNYTFDGTLGAIYGKFSTTFRVWSPVSRKIVLRLYENGTPKSVDSEKGNDKVYKEIAMERKEHGVFEAVVQGDLEGKYYTFVVFNAVYSKKEVVDPYARSTGVNGLRGMVVDFDKTNPEGFEKIVPYQINYNNLVVYETHIADLTASDTWSNDPKVLKYQKLFKGACLKGTFYTKDGITISTGFDHIRELGVNAVQLIPIFDQANDEVHPTYNWGYNPTNYNTLEGCYSTNPFDGYARIREFKELVKAYHEAGINIIMDVVYNHVNGAAGSNFDVLMPGYYFRYNDNGTLSNGSGCGNETASEMPMMRKFIIDSVCFWAKEYKLGGFRFDLMGLHDIETMDLLVEKVKEINPGVVVYGEPWAGGCIAFPYEEAANQSNLSRFKGYGAFNDKIRDALIRGGMNDKFARGWVTDNISRPNYFDLDTISNTVKGQINLGFLIKDASKLVNYVTCHDNYTLYDRIRAAGIEDKKEVKKMAMLANSIILTSNGISFILAGEEFLRGKGGNSNSYNASYKVNALDYDLKIKNFDMVKNYCKLIVLKKNIDKFAIKVEEGIHRVIFEKENVISYAATNKTDGKTYMIYHINGYQPSSLEDLNLDGYKFYMSTMTSSKNISSITEIEPYETLIVYK